MIDFESGCGNENILNAAKQFEAEDPKYSFDIKKSYIEYNIGEDKVTINGILYDYALEEILNALGYKVVIYVNDDLKYKFIVTDSNREFLFETISLTKDSYSDEQNIIVNFDKLMYITQL